MTIYPQSPITTTHPSPVAINPTSNMYRCPEGTRKHRIRGYSEYSQSATSSNESSRKGRKEEVFMA